MEYISIRDFEIAADGLIGEGLDRERSDKYFWAVKCYTMSREINLYLERMGKIKCADALIDDLEERNLITPQDTGLLTTRAKEKMEFLLGLACGGKKFLDSEKERQENI